MALFDRQRRGGLRDADAHRLVWDAGRRLRTTLETDLVVKTAAREIRSVCAGTAATFWLIGPGGILQQAGGPEGEAPPDIVRRVVTSWRPVFRPEHAAVPLLVPHAALHGVVLLAPGIEDRWKKKFLSELGIEIGYALQTARLVIQAAAERERSETIVSSVASGVVVTDTRGRVREWNQGAEQIFECPTPHALARSCGDVMELHIGERKLDCSAGCFLARAGSEAQGTEVWRPLADGRRQPLLASATGVGDSGEVVHSFRDITRLKEADEAKTQFLATASHELKTPLTVIQGFSDILLQQSADGEGSAEALNAIASRARSLNRIVDRILLSSRIESGRANVVLSTVDIGPILRERAGAFGRATDREVRTEVPVTPLLVRGDPEAISTVADHLIDNAIKYSPDGGGILVSARTRGDEIMVSVRDQGIGMDDEQAERCFEKFWQAEGSDARRFGGTGIGLFIVRSLVEAMDGEVRVESRRGAGTTFFFSLPRAEPASELPPGVGDRSTAREFMRQMGIRVNGES